MNIFKFLKSFRIGDFLSLFISITAVLLLFYFDFDSQSKPEIVEVKSGSSTWLYPLDSEVVFQPLDDIGTCIIEIKEKKARVISSDCPLNICISMGYIEKRNQWIACLPHKVFISIKGKNIKIDDNNLDGFVY